MNGPLDGIRVIDLSQVVSGPFATAMLADQGADVVSIEPVDNPDVVRSGGPLAPGAQGVSAMFASQNRNKRAIALDLKSEAGRDVLFDLVRDADVVVQNFRPGVVDRLGIGWDALSALNPRLVMVSISGFGSSGPYAHRPAFDPIIQSVTGFPVIQSDADGTPRLVKTIIADKVTSLNVAQAVCAALVARANGHGGQHVEVAMVDAAVHFLWTDAMWNHTYVDHELDWPDLNLTYHLYATLDGWAMVYPIANAGHWHRALDALGLQALEHDERFDAVNKRSANMAPINAALAAKIATYTTEQIVELMDSVDVPVAPVNTREQLLADPHVRARGIIEEMDHPTAGRIRMARSAALFSRTPSTLRRHAPTHGEHTDEILAEAGRSPEQIAALRAAGTVR
ncbi:MAG: CoA transferase [Acidimicrobiia bacterium]|nr:CoA transferase [Acidimicrobiia bacterium]